MDDRNKYMSAGGRFIESGRVDAPEIRNIDPDELQHQIERQFADLKDGKALTRALEVKEDKDGNSRWLFMKLPGDVARLLQIGLNTALPFLNKRGASFIYDTTKSFWEKNLERPNSSHSAGLNAAKIFSAILIGAEPLDRLVDVRREYAGDKKELMEKLAPIVSASKDYKKNEVISTAFDRLHDNAITGLKRFASQIPVLAGITIYALMDYGHLKKGKENALAINKMGAAHNDLGKVHDDKAAFFEKMRDVTNPGTGDKYTRQEILEEWHFERQNNLEELSRRLNNQDHEHSHTKSDDSMRVFTMPILAGAGAVIDSRVNKNSEKYKNPIALDLILELAHEVESSSPDVVSVDRILDIFQQNERDHGRPVIGQKLLPAFAPAIEQITESIADGRLNPIALVNLVGDGKVIIHSNGGSRKFASAKQTEELINEQLKSFSAHDLTSADEFFANFSEPQKMLELIKHNLDSMKGNETERALFAALFPDDILQNAGLKKNEIAELHKKAHDQMYGFVAATVIELANKEPEYLKKVGLGDEDIESLRELTKTLESDGMAPIKKIVDGKDKSIIDKIRTAGLYEQLKTGQNPWSERIKNSQAVNDSLIAASENTNNKSATEKEISRRKKRDQDPSEDLQRV